MGYINDETCFPKIQGRITCRPPKSISPISAMYPRLPPDDSNTHLSPMKSAAKWKAFCADFHSLRVADQMLAIRAGIAASHLCGLAATLNVPQTTIFHLAGLPPSSARRLIALNRSLKPSASERLLRIGAIESRAVTVFGNVDLAHAWLLARNVGLGGVSPLSMLDTGLGAQEVGRILNAIGYGGAI